MSIRPSAGDEAGGRDRSDAAAPGRPEIRLLGAMAVLRGGEAMPMPKSRKLRGLLCHLLLAGRPLHRSTLCDMFWDGPNDPRAELRWCLAKLRPLLDAPGTAALVADRDWVSIEIDPGAVDALAIADGLASGGVEVLAETELEQLASLFRGDLMEGLSIERAPAFQGWLVAKRHELRAAEVAIVSRLWALARGERAVAHAQTWARIAPGDIAAQEALLRGLLDLGRRGEARERLGLACAGLRREGADAEALRRRILHDLDGQGTGLHPRRDEGPAQPAAPGPEPSADTGAERGRPAQRPQAAGPALRTDAAVMIMPPRGVRQGWAPETAIQPPPRRVGGPAAAPAGVLPALPADAWGRYPVVRFAAERGAAEHAAALPRPRSPFATAALGAIPAFAILLPVVPAGVQTMMACLGLALLLAPAVRWLHRGPPLKAVAIQQFVATAILCAGFALVCGPLRLLDAPALFGPLLALALSSAAFALILGRAGGAAAWMPAAILAAIGALVGIGAAIAAGVDRAVVGDGAMAIGLGLALAQIPAAAAGVAATFDGEPPLGERYCHGTIFGIGFLGFDFALTLEPHLQPERRPYWSGSDIWNAPSLPSGK